MGRGYFENNKKEEANTVQEINQLIKRFFLVRMLRQKVIFN